MAERLLRQCVWREGLRYRIHRRDIPGSPDISFATARVAVFVDGDFWHGRPLQEHGVKALRAQVRGPRQGWWVEKLSRNAARDVAVTAALVRAGWRVLRFWETDILADPSPATAKIVRTVRRRNRSRAHGAHR